MAASIRRIISFPAPRRFHPGAGQRRPRLTDWSSITPSSTAAAASAQSSAAFTSRRSRENHPSPKPLPRQIPIGQPLTAVPRVRSSGAFGRPPPYLGDRSRRAGIRNPSRQQPFVRLLSKSRGASVRSEQNLGSKRRPIAPGLFYASTCRTFVRERYELGIRPLFQGSAKMITVDDAGGVLQNLSAAPDITPRYCLPPMA